MRHTLFLFVIFFTLIFTSCNLKNKITNELHSEDFVYVGDYTLGLEGPAVSSSGDLYFVIPAKNGTIGKVHVCTQKFEIFIDTIASGSIANGIRFNSKGDMLLTGIRIEKSRKFNPNLPSAPNAINEINSNYYPYPTIEREIISNIHLDPSIKVIFNLLALITFVS